MPDSDKQPGSDNPGSLPEPTIIKQFKALMALGAVLLVIYFIFLIYYPDSQLVNNTRRLWAAFLIVLPQNWLVYLAGLFIAWQVVGTLQKFLKTRIPGREKTLYPPAEGQPAAPGSVSPVQENAGGKVPDKRTAFLENVRTFLVLVIILYAVFVPILVNPVGKFMNYTGIRPPDDSLELLNCVCGLGGIGVIWLAIFSIKDYFSTESRARRDRPGFFEEMQESMRSILLPRGFEEKTSQAGLAQEVTFSRDQLIVSLWYDVRDQIYFVNASSTYSLEERERVLEAIAAKSKEGGNLDEMDMEKLYRKDFSVEGTILDADGFKSNAISQLHQWIAENNSG